MENATCRRCRRATDAGLYCSSCAADIMAKALNPGFGGRGKEVGKPETESPGPGYRTTSRGSRSGADFTPAMIHGSMWIAANMTGANSCQASPRRLHPGQMRPHHHLPQRLPPQQRRVFGCGGLGRFGEEGLTMRNELVADIGDYGKYGLLRSLFGRPELGEAGNPNHDLRLGVVWYYRANEEKDGNRLAYLFGPTPMHTALAQLDPFLHQCLKGLLYLDMRRVANVQQAGFLSVAAINYFAGPVQGLRVNWIVDACTQMAGADVVFLDPDNGIEPLGGGDQKHARIDDLCRIYNSENGKSLIVYQHRNDRGFPNVEGGAPEQMLTLVQRLRCHDNESQARNLPRLNGQIRIFQWHGKFFFIVFVHPNQPALNAELDAFAASNWCTPENFAEVTHWLGDLANHQH